MSDSEDDPGVALPRQKSIFSTMGRVRNMNQLREKWTARGKLSSSSASDFASEASTIGTSSSTLSAASHLSGKKRAGHVALSAAPATPSPTAMRPSEPPTPRALSAVEAQRFDALHAWIKRNGIDVSGRGAATVTQSGNVYDDIYDSLDDLEAAVKEDLAQLLPKWRTATAEDSNKSPSQAAALTAASRIVDYMVVIGPDLADLSSRSYWYGQEDVYEATVVFAHPPQCQFNAECIEQFCFPHGISPTAIDDHDAPEDFFVLVLSGGGDQGQSVQYACCLRKPVAIRSSVDGTVCSVPVCYGVVVGTPWIPFFRELLRHLAERHQSDLDAFASDGLLSNVVPDTLAQHIDSLMARIASMELPARGEELRFPPSSVLSQDDLAPQFSCIRPRIDCGSPETVALLLDWGMEQLLSTLSIPRIILILSILMVEMKVIVVSTSMSLLSAGTVGLAGLLYPLAWAGPLITILPPALHEYLEAPVPLLCGVDALPSNFFLTKGTAVLLMEKDEIQLHPDDAAQLGALQFPGSDELSRQLWAFANRLKLSPTEHTPVVTANFVMRRIRRQLQELLELCARVNPCNAYACMKQEQLSLSETLFLKSFMQSQMYQKYSDDLPTSQEPVVIAETVVVSPPPPPPPPSLQPLVASLKGPLTDLFLLAITGSCERGSAKAEEASRELNGGQNEEVASTQASSNSQTETDPIGRQQPSSKSVSPHDRSRGASPRIGPTTVGDVEFVDGASLELARETIHSPAAAQWSKAFAPVIPADVELSPNVVASPVERDEGDDAFQPSKPQRSEARSPSLHEIHASVSRSMPDVFKLVEQRPVGRSETESLAATSLWPHAVAATENQLRVKTGQAHQSKTSADISNESNKRAVVERVTRTIAAIKMQRAWRQHRHKRKPRSPPPPMNSVAIPSPREASSTTTNESRAGTVLSMMDGGKQVSVVMRLSEDSSALQWYHRHKLRGSIMVADVGVVKAQDGDIVIQTTAGDNYTFSVPAHRADQVMAFFQALHRLATSTTTPTQPLPVSGDRSGEDVVASPPATLQRQESARHETTSYAKETSIHESKRSVLEGVGSAGASSFLSFDESIRKGVLVLKHGRMGRPHPKFLICDDTQQILAWTDPVVTNAGYQTPQPAATEQTGAQPEKKGIRFDEMLEVKRGKQTRVFHRSTAGRSNADLCFSIVTRGRTLDIETFSPQDFAMLLDGIIQRVGLTQESSG